MFAFWLNCQKYEFFFFMFFFPLLIVVLVLISCIGMSVCKLWWFLSSELGLIIFVCGTDDIDFSVTLHLSWSKAWFSVNFDYKEQLPQ